MTDRERWIAYLSALEGPFLKLARLDFLQPDGSLAFSIDNNPKTARLGHSFRRASYPSTSKTASGGRPRLPYPTWTGLMASTSTKCGSASRSG